MTTTFAETRPAAVAGTFYPGDAAELAEDVDAMLARAAAGGVPREATSAPPKAIVAPHAGYVYSGPVAAAAYARVRAACRGQVTRVVLVGPCHRARVRGVAVPKATRFATPLGEVAVDHAAFASLRSAGVPLVESDPAHAREHSLEVQLPFLQRALGGERPFAVVPLAVGDVSAQEVALALDVVWGGPETLVVVSTDLSHYLPYAVAREVDRATAGRVASLSLREVDHQQACGATGLNALVAVARRRGLRPALLDLRSSGDTAGPRDGVVGYAAFAFYEDGHAASAD